MKTTLSPASRSARDRARVGIAAAAFAALAGCSATPAMVTVTVGAPPAATTAATTTTTTTTTTAPAKPAPHVTPAPAKPGTTTTAPGAPGSASVVVTQGAVADQCTHTVCHYVHVAWKNLTPGAHDTQCVTDAGTMGAWSHSTYNYATADGEQDLGCFLGYPGSHVWVVIDGTLESVHAAWG